MNLKKIGIVIPSSNTVVEPTVCRMLSDIDEVSVHFSRIEVKQIGWTEDAKKQFSQERLFEAVELLRHANVDVIVYCATSAAWLGIEQDRALCTRITEEFGIPATTTVLSLLDCFKFLHVKKYAMICAYTEDLVHRMLRQLGDEGYRCESWRTFSISDNYQISQISEEELLEQAEGIKYSGAPVLTTFGTNVWSAHLAPVMEQSMNGLLVIDSISVTVWKIMSILGIPAGRLAKWGGLFARS